MMMLAGAGLLGFSRAGVQATLLHRAAADRSVMGSTMLNESQMQQRFNLLVLPAWCQPDRHATAGDPALPSVPGAGRSPAGCPGIAWSSWRSSTPFCKQVRLSAG